MIINFTQPIMQNFLVKTIYWLVEVSGSIALGIVLFTLLLKLITLPFDYMSRASMRKNTVKMEEMRPELEKLQKQYADNKELYNQKMMALYKKNGYSMFGACLPTILTLVIFIVAINAFTNYSQYQNKKYFYDMSCAYNNVVYAGFEIDGEYIKNENGVITFESESLYNLVKDEEDKKAESGNVRVELVEETNGNGKLTSRYMLVYTEPGYVKAKIQHNLLENKWAKATFDNIIESGISSSSPLASEQNNFLKIYKEDGTQVEFADSNLSAKEFIKDIQQEKSAQTFREENSSFLWVKNIWVTDSTTKHPVESSWEVFKQTHEYLKDQPNATDILDTGYAELTMKLEKEKTQPNGYFILVALTAGVSLLMQIVTSKTQKAQMELQTVDGQGAQTQKMMTWMMPIMMAFFAFMYTAAFSIYIILSSIISVCMTFVINFIVDKQMKKQKINTQPKKVRGRIYVPKKEDEVKKEEPKKKDKNDRFAHENGGDFLTGPVKKKRK